MDGTQPPAERIGASAGAAGTSVGAAAAQLLVISATAVVLHLSPLGEGWTARALKWIVLLSLHVGLFFPLYAIQSPSPANGPKLILFPLLTFVSLLPWIPPPVREPASLWWALLLMLAAALVGNGILLLLRSGGVPVRRKTIRWSAGGRPFGVVVAAGVASAAFDGMFISAGFNEERSVMIILLYITTFFLLTRATTHTKTAVAGSIAAPLVFAAVAAAGPDGLASQRFHALTKAAVLLGMLFYSCSHLGGSGARVWAMITFILLAGIFGNRGTFIFPAAAGILTLLFMKEGERPVGGTAALAMSAVMAFIGCAVVIARALQWEGGYAAEITEGWHGWFRWSVVAVSGAIAWIAILRLPGRSGPLAWMVASMAALATGAAWEVEQGAAAAVAAWFFMILSATLFAPAGSAVTAAGGHEFV